MKQYLELKSKYPDALLFFRMGDFYELFLEDAITAAPLMDVALTKRQGSIPMAGVPYHSAEIYINRLLQHGKKIAIAEQIVDKKNPRLMQRKVVRMITPGTIIEDNLLKFTESQYIMSFAKEKDNISISFLEVSTGEFFSYLVSRESQMELLDYCISYHPREIVTIIDWEDELKFLLKNTIFYLSFIESWKATYRECLQKIENFYQTNKSIYDNISESIIISIGILLFYIEEVFPDQKISIEIPKIYSDLQEFLILDESTIKNLNLFEPKETSLYALFSPVTAGGKRLLKEFILHPLRDIKEIRYRESLVKFFYENHYLSQKLENLLKNVSDYERTLTRMEVGKSSPRDIKNYIGLIETSIQIQTLLEDSELDKLIVLHRGLIDLKNYLQNAIVENPPALLGNYPFLKKGFDSEYDEALTAREKGALWILEFEKKEKERTGISSLKVRYNKVTGYNIEVSKGQVKFIPDNYERRQTLINYERFTSEELKQIENKILNADNIINQIEEKYFEEFINKILQYRLELKSLMKTLSFLDLVINFAKIGRENQWVCPEWNNEKKLILMESRHPVLECFLPKHQDFIPNDVYLDTEENSLAIITGPNMAGKSTYIRQVGIIQILAQMGSFVPAKRANLSIVDRVFTRVGASDNLAKGESTFLVEMMETARILNYFTEDSLIIMDEVGRGTSTYDGLSIAWSIVEYLTEEVKPKTLFATHFHELTRLEERKGVFNLTMEILEDGENIIFLHKVKKGIADKSYGIYVAKLAGIPRKVIHRAQNLLAYFESQVGKSQVPNEYQEEIEFKKARKVKKNNQYQKQIELF